MRRTTLAALAAVCVGILATPYGAMAHPGQPGHGIMAGLAHPVSGADHVLAMLAVGLWATQLAGRARWLVPAAFVGVMGAGGLVRVAGLGVPVVEAGILASILVLGLLILTATRLPAAPGMALAALFAVFHGAAHAAEIPAGAGAAAFAVGFVATTAALIACGTALALAAARVGGSRWVRAGGGAVTAGAVLLVLARLM